MKSIAFIFINFLSIFMSFASAGENLVLYPEANLEVPQ